jgi:hypothetical protein
VNAPGRSVSAALATIVIPALFAPDGELHLQGGDLRVCCAVQLLAGGR